MAAGDKWFRAGQFTGVGPEKLQGRGEIDPEFHSLTEAIQDAIKAGHIPPALGEGIPRALQRATQKGMIEVLESIERYEKRLRSGELGTLSGIKVAVDIRKLVENKMLRVVGPTMF